MRTYVLAAWLGLTLLPAPVSSAPEPAEEAERLFQAGNRAARRQRWTEALRDWERAEALEPTWQPAYNQSTVLLFLGRPLDGWAACQRALEREIPEDRRAKIEAECEAIERKLLGTHAELRLQVEPADAVVELEGRPWYPPRRTFVPRVESKVRVASAGYAPQQLRWAHPIGQRHNEVVRLVPLPPAVPEAPPTEAPLAAAPPSAPSAAPMTLAAAVLAPRVAEPVATGPSSAWKWIAWTGAVAAGVGGAWLLADAEDLRTPRVFQRDASAAEEAYTSRQNTGIALLAGAGVGLAAGLALWWWEGP